MKTRWAKSDSDRDYFAGPSQIESESCPPAGLILEARAFGRQGREGLVKHAQKRKTEIGVRPNPVPREDRSECYNFLLALPFCIPTTGA
jgi:hypothetical protein